jgi:hypothetical protein
MVTVDCGVLNKADGGLVIPFQVVLNFNEKYTVVLVFQV